VNCTETAEPIDMLFGLWTWVGRRKHKVNRICQVSRIRQVAPMCPHGRAHWRHLSNTIKPSICGNDVVLCHLTLTTCLNHCLLFIYSHGYIYCINTISSHYVYFARGSACTYCDKLCLSVCPRGYLWNHMHNLYQIFLSVLPMSVALSSSGMLTIGSIVYQQEGGDGSAQRGRIVIYDCLLQACCFCYVTSITKVAEHLDFLYPFHMFVDHGLIIVGYINVIKFLYGPRKFHFISMCLCPVEAPSKLKCREISITEISWFICHRISMRFLWVLPLKNLHGIHFHGM